MRKNALLIISCILSLAVTGCFKDNGADPVVITSEDDVLAGEVVTVGEESLQSFYKLFVLNEGNFNKNEASLDFFRFTDGKYVRNAFSQMNPIVTGGLGSVANDFQLYYNTAWITVNQSNLVEVIHAKNEKHVTSFEIPSPREIAFDGSYAYVTSYAGAYYGGEDRLGALYRINLATEKVDGHIEVGYQPEGVTVCGDYVFVANSGGFHTGYDNRVTVIDRASFTVIRQIEVAPNLKEIVSDGQRYLWVQSQGNWGDIHSGIYQIDAESFTVVPQTNDLKNVRASVTYFDPIGNYFYVIGTEDEFDWGKTNKDYTLWSIHAGSGKVQSKAFSADMRRQISTPYGMAIDPIQGVLYITDSGNGTNPGTVSAFDSDQKMKWTRTATAGFFPGHLALYYPYRD